MPLQQQPQGYRAPIPPQPQQQFQFRPMVQPSPVLGYNTGYARPMIRPVIGEDEVVTGRAFTPEMKQVFPDNSVVSGRFIPSSADTVISSSGFQTPTERPYERLTAAPPTTSQALAHAPIQLVPTQQQHFQQPQQKQQYNHPRPPQSFAQPLIVNRPANMPFESVTHHQQQQLQQSASAAGPVGLNNLITPTRVTPSTPGQVTFRLPDEFEKSFSKKLDTGMRATTPTSESFRRITALPVTPDNEWRPKRSNWGRSKSADRRYSKEFFWMASIILEISNFYTENLFFFVNYQYEKKEVFPF